MRLEPAAHPLESAVRREVSKGPEGETRVSPETGRPGGWSRGPRVGGYGCYSKYGHASPPPLLKVPSGPSHAGASREASRRAEVTLLDRGNIQSRRTSGGAPSAGDPYPASAAVDKGGGLPLSRSDGKRI